MGNRHNTNNHDNRYRNWTFLLYPESMPSNSWDLIDDLHIAWIASPIHDKDIEKDGSPKKPHYHVMLLFSGKQPYDKVLSMLEPLGVKYLEVVSDANVLARYFSHMDNPEKAQYSHSDYKFGGGVTLSRYLAPTADQVQGYIYDMQVWVRDTPCFEYSDLLDFAAENAYDTWHYALTHCCSNIMINYINSYRNKCKGGSSACSPRTS